ncbi:hypothetical protein [Larkinella soli]|uniref:hypothetical protein n=1 Tax=Larkinella soli TaxID=1770527 RepID=UPI000FFB5A9F|nr:hypothetical protein [Larkinella soli]
MKKVILWACVITALGVTSGYAQQNPGRRADSTANGRSFNRFRDMTPIEAKDLPAEASAYLKKEYASAEVRRMAKDAEGKFFVVLASGDTRRVLTFDAKGALVNNREMMGRGPRGGGQRRR